MPNAQQGVWRQAGRGLVGHFARFWEFTSRPSFCETPPARQAPKTVKAYIYQNLKNIYLQQNYFFITPQKKI